MKNYIFDLDWNEYIQGLDGKESIKVKAGSEPRAWVRLIQKIVDRFNEGNEDRTLNNVNLRT